MPEPVLPALREAFEPDARPAFDTLSAVSGATMGSDVLAQIATVSLAISAKRIADALESVVDPSYDQAAIRTRESR